MTTLDVSQICTKSWGSTDSKTRKRNRRKLEILMKCEFACTLCGVLEELTIHHEVPFCEKYKSRSNTSSYKVNECTILCQKCHMNLHKVKDGKN
jgi:5-methylcytosine-specific restriction endonuclease McrA